MSAPTKPLIGFNRTVSDTFLDALRPGGELRFLIDHPRVAELGVDVQLRSNGRVSWMSMYLGLTSVLDVVATGTKFHLNVHAAHKRAAGFNSAWTRPGPLGDLAAQQSQIEKYLDKILAPSAVHARYTNSEGRVQAAISMSATDDFGAFQREAVPSFPSESIRNHIASVYKQRMWHALTPQQHQKVKWWPGVRDNGVLPRLGLEADLLAIDDEGRLLVIEVKPANEIKGITWASGQARLYAEMFALWLETDPHARDQINSMIAQRRALGLPAPSTELPTQPSIRVVPVVSIGDGTISQDARPRLWKVHHALQTAPSLSARLDPLEVWRHDAHGTRVERWFPDTEPA